MIPDESVAYAIATWSRFEGQVTDELLRALSGAFALVAAADGELQKSEVEGFLELLRSKADVFSGVDFAELETSFRDLCEAIEVEPEDGKDRALAFVVAVKADSVHRELVSTAAEIAAAADGSLQPAEISIVEQIRSTLGASD